MEGRVNWKVWQLAGRKDLHSVVGNVWQVEGTKVLQSGKAKANRVFSGVREKLGGMNANVKGKGLLLSSRWMNFEHPTRKSKV